MGLMLSLLVASASCVSPPDPLLDSVHPSSSAGECEARFLKLAEKPIKIGIAFSEITSTVFVVGCGASLAGLTAADRQELFQQTEDLMIGQGVLPSELMADPDKRSRLVRQLETAAEIGDVFFYRTSRVEYAPP